MSNYRRHGCPKCGTTVEFRGNEIRRKCPKCGAKLRVVADVESGAIVRTRLEEDDG